MQSTALRFFTPLMSAEIIVIPIISHCGSPFFRYVNIKNSLIRYKSTEKEFVVF